MQQGEEKMLWWFWTLDWIPSRDWASTEGMANASLSMHRFSPSVKYAYLRAPMNKNIWGKLRKDPSTNKFKDQAKEWDSAFPHHRILQIITGGIELWTLSAVSQGCFFSSKLHLTYELFIYLAISSWLKCTLCRALWAQVQNNNGLVSNVLWKLCKQADSGELTRLSWWLSVEWGLTSKGVSVTFSKALGEQSTMSSDDLFWKSGLWDWHLSLSDFQIENCIACILGCLVSAEHCAYVLSTVHLSI